MRRWIGAGLLLLAPAIVSAAPTQIGQLPLVGLAAVATDGAFAYTIGTEGLTIVDLAEPTAPAVTATLLSPNSFPGAVCVVGPRAYLAYYDGWHGGRWQGIVTVNITDRGNPRNLGTFGCAESVDPYNVLAGDALVAFGQNATDIVFDDSDPLHPFTATGLSGNYMFPYGQLCATQSYNTLRVYRYQAGAATLIDTVELSTLVSLHAGEAARSHYLGSNQFCSVGSTTVNEGGVSSERQKLVFFSFDTDGFHVERALVMGGAGGYSGMKKVRAVSGGLFALPHRSVSFTPTVSISMAPVSDSTIGPSTNLALPADILDFEVTGNLLLAITADALHVFRIAAPPSITGGPISQTAVEGGSLALSVTANASTGLSYQWLKDGQPIPNATQPVYSLPSVQLFHAGSYACAVSGLGGTVTSPAASVSVTVAAESSARLMNLSTRALGLSGDNLFIPGFVVSGPDTKTMLIRAIGPTLSGMGVPGAMPSPTLQLKKRSGQEWVSVPPRTPTDPIIIQETERRVGAFPRDPGAADQAYLYDLTAGVFSALVEDASGSSGIAMVELYDADTDNAGGARLVNISNRGFVDVGDRIMIPGFVVSNEGSRTFLIRAVGPGLRSTFGLQGILEDPVLTVFNSAGQAILSNDDWDGIAGSTTTSTVSGQVGAFPLVAGSPDAAFVVTLPPGGYTIQATGKAGTTGVALVEVYLVP